MLDFNIIMHHSCTYIQVNKYTKKMCDAGCHLLKQNKLSVILFAVDSILLIVQAGLGLTVLQLSLLSVWMYIRRGRRGNLPVYCPLLWLPAYCFDASSLPEPGALFSWLSWNPASPNNLRKFTQMEAEAMWDTWLVIMVLRSDPHSSRFLSSHS